MLTNNISAPNQDVLIQIKDSLRASLGLDEIFVKEPLRKVEEEWLDDSCYQRYWKASKMDLDNCVKRLIETLKWRRDFKPHLIHPDEVEAEAKSELIHCHVNVCSWKGILYWKRSKGATNSLSCACKV